MKKKLALLVCATLLLSLILPIISASAVIGPQWVYAANGKPVRVRAYPSKDAEILTYYKVGTRLTSCVYYDNTWTEITYKGKPAYIMTKYLVSHEVNPPKPTPTPTRKPSPTPASNVYASMQKVNYYVVVNPSNGASYANLRWAPDSNAPIMYLYYPGYQLKVLYTNDTWSQVLDEATGYCGFMRTFLIQPIGVGVVAQ